MRFIDGKPDLPVQDPFLPVNRGVAGHRSLVEMDSHDDIWKVTLHFPDIQVEKVRVEATEQGLTIFSETEPPIRHAVEAPRCLNPKTLKIERESDLVKVEVRYQEDPCIPLSPSPGGAYRTENAPCIEHPRCNTQEKEESHIATA